MTDKLTLLAIDGVSWLAIAWFAALVLGALA